MVVVGILFLFRFNHLQGWLLASSPSVHPFHLLPVIEGKGSVLIGYGGILACDLISGYIRLPTLGGCGKGKNDGPMDNIFHKN
jgi:hypothetical protein